MHLDKAVLIHILVICIIRQRFNSYVAIFTADTLEIVQQISHANSVLDEHYCVYKSRSVGETNLMKEY